MEVSAHPDATPAAASALRPDDGDVAACSKPPEPLKPWEQHGGVIHMPRYLYSSDAAPLLHRSGFLITCAFRREKSATKEAVELLHEFLSVSAEPHGGDDIEPHAKRARTGAHLESAERKSPSVEAGPLSGEVGKIRSEEVDEQTPRSVVQGKVGGANADDEDARRNGLGVDNAQALPETERGAAEFKHQEFHLVKLARNGMVYISIPSRSPGDLVTFFAKIIKDLHTRSRAAPSSSARPGIIGTSVTDTLEATCLWTKEDVRSTVAVLVKEFVAGHNISSNKPLKYGVAVNRRGLDEKEKTGEGAAHSTGTFGKLDCIHAVTEAIQSLTPHVSVDLTNPQMVVILEVLPLVRVETTVCAVSVLPRELVVTKPKLVMLALAPPKQQKEKKKQK